ncbi:MAG: hypothetical protein J0L62_03965 [Bacteroidetes bacterium]|nr:hypothetical protein [Bacteroidota bacterium]
MNKLVLSVILFLGFTSLSEAQVREWSWSAGFGVSKHYFYSVTDYLSGFGDNIDRGQSAITTELRLNKDFYGIFGIGLTFNFDYTTLNQSIAGNEQSYGYSAHIFSLYPYWIIASEKQYHWVAGIQTGKISYGLSTTGVGAFLPKSISGNGWLFGLRSDVDLLTGEITFFQLSGGLQVKTSESVKRGNSSFNFKSLDAWVRMGVIYDI